jgi:predicted metal-dependent HD superfamily phosphohydrolase
MFRGTVPRCLNAVVDLPDSWPLSAADDVRDALLTAYADPSRSYHDTRHLGEVVDRLGELGAAGVAYERVPVLLAAWFHDAVYDGERDAEERSAVWAEDALAGVLDPAVVAEVARLVRLTETHRPEDDDRNGCALSDADLAILAAAPERYQEYVAAVRREFAHVDDESFRRGRAGVLRALLDKGHLFHTGFAREAWERPARANVEAELAALEA